MTKQEIHDLQCKNLKYEYEFPAGKFLRGWRGDRWCITCDFTIFSSEATRMAMFCLGKVLNPPTMTIGKAGVPDHEMFRVGELTI